jgi:hypothetical protein
VPFLSVEEGIWRTSPLSLKKKNLWRSIIPSGWEALSTDHGSLDPSLALSLA